MPSFLLRARGLRGKPGVPIPFELSYDPARIDPDHAYAVKAVIKSGGRTLFQSERSSPVVTRETRRR
jgi:putative lipoprotein